MMNNVLTQIEELVSVNINVALIIILMFVGLFLKRAITKLDNSWIPLILGVLGMVIAVLMRIPFNPQTDLLNILVEGLVAAAFATILHTKVKDILTQMKDHLGSSTTTTEKVEDKTEE